MMTYLAKNITIVVLALTALALSIGATSAATAAAAAAPPGFLRHRKTAVVDRVLPEFPYSRFVVWDKLNGATRNQVKNLLDYDKRSWNIPGTADIESLSYASINRTSLMDNSDVAVQKNTPLTAIDVIATTLEISEESWDCHMNHYADFNWTELVGAGVAKYFQALGWNNRSWVGEISPPRSEGKDYFELTDSEKQAAKNICFSPEAWAGDVEVDLYDIPEPTVEDPEDEEPDDGNPTDADPADSELGNVNPNGGDTTETPENDHTSGTVITIFYVPRVNISLWELPKTRLTPWKNLTQAQKNDTMVLGYTERTWNNIGMADIENDRYNFTAFGQLTIQQVESFRDLGIDRFWYDCFIQHYYSYSWNELVGEGVQHWWKLLNWTYDSWHGFSPPPKTMNMTFDKLSVPQQESALQLCFLPETYFHGGNLADINRTNLVAPTTNAAPAVP